MHFQPPPSLGRRPNISKHLFYKEMLALSSPPRSILWFLILGLFLWFLWSAGLFFLCCPKVLQGSVMQKLVFPKGIIGSVMQKLVFSLGIVGSVQPMTNNFYTYPNSSQHQILYIYILIILSLVFQHSHHKHIQYQKQSQSL